MGEGKRWRSGVRMRMGVRGGVTGRVRLRGGVKVRVKGRVRTEGEGEEGV